MRDGPHWSVWLLAGLFVLFVAGTGQIGLAAAAAASLGVLWWRIGQNET